MLPLAMLLNPKAEPAVLQKRLEEIFTYANYRCYGWDEGGKILAMCGAWTLTKLYSGKQLEVDNVAVALEAQSKGIGTRMMDEIESLCRRDGYESIELNAYTGNVRGHRFYSRKGYDIVGFHFRKKLTH